MKILKEIAREAWLAAPLDADYWEAAASAVRKAVLQEAIDAANYEAQFFDANGKQAVKRINSVLQRLQSGSGK